MPFGGNFTLFGQDRSADTAPAAVGKPGLGAGSSLALDRLRGMSGCGQVLPLLPCAAPGALQSPVAGLRAGSLFFNTFKRMVRGKLLYL